MSNLHPLFSEILKSHGMPDQRAKPGDKLDMAYINSLPQPLMARRWGSDDRWFLPVHDIDVQTGLVRIDVCGKLEAITIGDIAVFRDAAGKDHNPDDFWLDSERATKDAA